MSMFSEPNLFGVGSGIVKDVHVSPQSGINLGDPLSPAIFVMVCSVLVKTIYNISPCIHVFVFFQKGISTLAA